MTPLPDDPQLLPTVLETVASLVVVMDCDGRIVLFNRACREATGYDAAEAMGRTPWDFLLPDDIKDDVRDVFSELVAGDFPNHFENVWLTKDGRALTIAWTNSATVDESGAIRHVIGTGIDITQRVEAEHNLRRSEQEVRTILDTLIDTFYRTDDQGRITIISKSAERALGYSLTELIGMKITDLYVDADERAAFIKTLQDEGRVPKFEARLRRKDGRIIWVQSSSRVILDEDGAYAGVEGIARDITEAIEQRSALQEARDALEMRVEQRTRELKESKERLRTALQNAEHANRAKTDFLANMSHELRTPLNAIIGFSNTMQSEIYGALGHDKYIEYVRDIHDSGQHLLEMINDILDVAAIEAGTLELSEHAFDVKSAIKTALRYVQHKADEDAIHLDAVVPEDIPRLYADERRMLQILLNLLSNAVKFTPRNGTVRIMAALSDDGGLDFTVTDNGIGMNAGDLRLAMTEFGQVDSSLAKKYEGTGLGLPLTQSLIQLHGGRMEITSAKGEGTTIVIHMPATRTVHET